MATRPVVVGVDGSEESLRAVEWAAVEAGRRRSPLRIVSAPAIPPRMHAHAFPVTVASTLREISGRALGAAVTRAEEVAPGLLVDTDLLSGAPALALAECGSGASMLVVGARGAGGFAAMILGSVSRYAAMHTPCPVVVVRQETMAVHREITIGIRDPQDPTEALAFAFEEAALRNAELVAIHAWSWFPPALRVPGGEGDATPQPTDPQQVSADAAARLAEALNGWRSKYPEVRVRHEVVHCHPARVLASYSARSDLVVLGRHVTPSEAGPGIGSIQHAVLNHATGPVAVIPSSE
jgi:nucleotide-binding universal stress UspA family protein